MQLMQVRPFMLWVLTLAMIIITLLHHQNQITIRSLQLLHNQIMSEKETVLHFFLHDTPGGDNPGAIKVIQAIGTTTINETALTPFGTVWVVDDPLTEGPEPTSRVVGNCRGVYVSAGQDELMLVAYLDFGFISAEFNGSSISMFSRNPVTENEREFVVVGGLGKFRMARGFAKLNCIFYNQSNGDSIVEYTVVLRHY